MKNKVFNRLSGVFGDSPLTLLFCIYITLFISIEVISIEFSFFLGFSLLVIVIILKKKLLIEITLISLLLLIISINLMPMQAKLGSQTVVGKIKSINHNSFDFKIENDKHILIGSSYVRVYDEIPNKTVGSKAVVKLELTKIKEARNPGEFSNKKYLNSLGITAVSSSCDLIKAVKSNKIQYYINRLREILLESLKKFPLKEKDLLTAMLLGDKSKLSDEIKGNFQNAGVSHLLVVSGLHLTILVAIIKYIFDKLSIKDAYQIIIIIPIIWIYALLAGFSFSIVRASLMNSTYLIFRYFNKRISKVENILLVVIIVLVIYPYALKNVGWQLSFLATFGILVLTKKISKKLPKSRLNTSLSVILSAQIMTFPIIVTNFNVISILLIPANLLMVPLTTFILVSSLTTFVPYIGHFLIGLVTFALRIQMNTTAWIASLESFIFFMKDWPLHLIIIYYLLIFVIFFTKFINLKKILLAGFVFIFIFIHIDFSSQVVFLDVGQGDSAFIETSIFEGNQKILIDCGDVNKYEDSGKDILIPFLKSRGIKKIDYLFLSHAHKDHIGGAISLLKTIEVEEILMSLNSLQYESTQLDDLISIINNKNIKVRVIEQNNRVEISNNSFIDVFNPKENSNLSENNSSLVLKFVIDDKNILFTGDIEKEAEKNLLDKYDNSLKADILKIPHHGSKTSSSELFVKTVNPKVAINSSKKDHFLNHPDKEVILRYNNKRVNLFRTDLDGAITITIKDYLHIQSFLSKKEEKLWLSQQWMS